MSVTGRESLTRLVVIRGNSASGKSAVAAEIRRRHGRGLAIVGQDNLRRQVLRERDVPGGANIELIGLTARLVPRARSASRRARAGHPGRVVAG